MTNKISVVCVNADDMRLRITAEMTVGEWKHVLADTAMTHSFDSPTYPLKCAIRSAIEAIEKREDVEFVKDKLMQWNGVSPHNTQGHPKTPECASAKCEPMP